MLVAGQALGASPAALEPAERAGLSRCSGSPQELQVARMAGQGLTNRQIAEQLFLSAHTVGYHLHKVYAKLGISTRAALSRFDLKHHRGR